MRIKLGVVAVLLLSALVVGCFEIKQDATINPDGSGKAVVEVTMPDMPNMDMGSSTGTDAAAKKAPDQELLLKQFVKETMESAKGVEAWTDVSFSRADDGRMKFKGTAFFKDFAKMHVGQGEGAGGITWAKDEKGMVLTMDPNDKKGAAPAAAAPPAMTDEEVAKKVAQAQTEYNQMRPMMEAMMGKMKMEMIFHLPGTLGEVTGFQKMPDGSVKFALDGAKMLAVTDELMKDTAYVTAQIKAGKKPGNDKSDPALNEKIFGTKGALTAHVTGTLKPQFDYAAEVKAAKDAQPKMIEKLGLDGLPAKTGMSIMPGMGDSGPPPSGPPPAKAPATTPTSTK